LEEACGPSKSRLAIRIGIAAPSVHLAAESQLSPSQRLESLFERMRFGDDLARAELRPLPPRES